MNYSPVRVQKLQVAEVFQLLWTMYDGVKLVEPASRRELCGERFFEGVEHHDDVVLHFLQWG